MPDVEEPLAGNVTAGVVRVGSTVRRPAGPWTDSVDALLTHLARVGFTGAPRPLGRDDRGRQVLEYVPGEVGDSALGYPEPELRAIGRMLRDYHDAAASFVPPPGAVWNRVIQPDREEIICHHDPAPWNLVRAAGRWVLIDWDAAGPGSRLWDLAYAAQSMVPLVPGGEPHLASARLRAFTDGYGLDADGRERLPAMLGRRARAMYALLRDGAAAGRQPWARIWTEDGPYWRNTADYLDRSVAIWSAALTTP